jgi:hypothetical protein
VLLLLWLHAFLDAGFQFWSWGFFIILFGAAAQTNQTLVELAKVRNSIPLPKIIGAPGIALPPELNNTLIAPNYQLAVPTRTFREMEEEEEDEMEWEEGDGNNSKAHHDTSPKDVNNASSLLHQPTHLQKSDQDGHKVSFSIAAAAKRPKT